MNWDKLLGELEARAAGTLEPDNQLWLELAHNLERIAGVIVRSMGLPSEDAQDLTQSLLLKLQSPEVLQRVRTARSPEGYMVTMARNAAYSLRRKQAAEHRAMAMLTQESDPAISASEEGVMEEKERRLRLRQELLNLSAENRELLRLKYWEEVPLTELAKRASVKYSTMAVRIFRLIRKLEVKLSGA